MLCPTCGHQIEHEIGFDLASVWKVLAEGTAETMAEMKEAGHSRWPAPLEDLIKNLNEHVRPLGFTVMLSKCE
jgi:hypothetical protein